MVWITGRDKGKPITDGAGGREGGGMTGGGGGSNGGGGSPGGGGRGAMTGGVTSVPFRRGGVASGIGVLDDWS